MIPLSIASIQFDTSWTLLLIGVAIAWRIFMDRCDRGRIRDHIASGGGRVLSISWNPFGKGWFGERGDRIYDVTYTNEAGKTIQATCKTSMLTGLFWSSDTPPSDFSSKATEPTPCLSCGAVIPAKSTRCPQCDWSYDEQQSNTL